MYKRVLLAAVGLVLMGAVSASAAGERIDWQVIAAGGGNGSSTNYRLSGTVGQTAAGAGSSANYRVNQGFWQDFGSGGCCVLRGDFNEDGAVKVSDLTGLINYLFRGGPAPAAC